MHTTRRSVTRGGPSRVTAHASADTLVLSAADVARVVEAVGADALMDELIAALETALRGFRTSSIEIPARDGFDYVEPVPGLLEWMPLLDPGRAAMVKLVGYHPHNPASNALPTILSTTLSFDTATGHLSCIVDATFTTALRTGAASAVASRVLARPGSSVLGIVGAGAQAVAQIHALSRVFAFERVLVFDVDHAASESLEARARSIGVSAPAFEIAPLEAVVAGAHILCTATSVPAGAGPVIPDADLRPGLHVNAVGSDFPGKRELPDALLARAFVCPDFWDQASREGECQALDARAAGPEFPELVRDAAIHRGQRDALTVFDSTGWALEDAVAVDTVRAHAERLGLGTRMSLESIAGDPRNPYPTGAAPGGAVARPVRAAGRE